MKEAPKSVLIRLSALLRGATEQIEVRFLKSLKQGVTHPAVFVLDLDDPLGQQIVSKVKTQKEIDKFRARPMTKGVFHVVFWHMPAEVAANYLPNGYSEIAHQLRDWGNCAPRNCFPAILATGGAISVVAMPIPET